MKRPVASIILTVVIILSLLMIIGCQVESEPAKTPSSASSSPIPKSPEKGNPKLDSQLNQLIQAENLGNAEAFAQQSNIELVYGAVRVIIECFPGQLESATEAATNAGAELETRYDNLLQALAPIASLTTLANEESIRFIRLPQQPVSGAK